MYPFDLLDLHYSKLTWLEIGLCYEDVFVTKQGELFIAMLVFAGEYTP